MLVHQTGNQHTQKRKATQPIRMTLESTIKVSPLIEEVLLGSVGRVRQIFRQEGVDPNITFGAVSIYEKCNMCKLKF